VIRYSERRRGGGKIRGLIEGLEAEAEVERKEVGMGVEGGRRC
jgi:hypothetical protein